jgi:hypothetical protein
MNLTILTKQNVLITSILISGMLLYGCKKSDPSPSSSSTPSYSIPTTYNQFTNVDYSESAIVVGMTTALSNGIALGTGVSPATVPTALNLQVLLNLLSNYGNPFNSGTVSYKGIPYNTSGFSIEGNTLPSSQAQLIGYLDSLVSVSNSGNVASSGVAGLGLSKDATPKRYLLSANGINYAQVLKKALMNDLVLYQISNRVQNFNLDNTVSVSGKNYTALEHNWDVAFGYYGVPDSFPIIKSPLSLWGSYSNQVDSGLHCNRIVMTAFLTGRAAIVNKDMATLQAQADIIVTEFDIMNAGAVCQELNEIQTALNAGDVVKLISALSECYGFVLAMQNNTNPNRKISNDQIATLLSYFPTNFWNVKQSDLDTIRNYIGSIYGFTSAQSLIL